MIMKNGIKDVLRKFADIMAINNQNKPKLRVMHCKENHSLDEPCKFCDKVKREYNQNKDKIKELDIIQEKASYKRGTVVNIYQNGKAFEVEFINNSGATKAIKTLSKDEIVKVWNYDKKQPK